MDCPRPPSPVAPSIWKAEVETPHRNSDGKVGFSTGDAPFHELSEAQERNMKSSQIICLYSTVGNPCRHDKVADQRRRSTSVRHPGRETDDGDDSAPAAARSAA